MPVNRPVALQLYSVRHACERDLYGVLRKVAEFGYEGVEFAGFYGHEPADIRRQLDDLGLKAEGTHTGIGQLSDAEFAATVEAHKTLDAPYCIVPGLPEDMRNTPTACAETAKKLTELTHKLEAHGLRCGFHAHHADLLPLEGGKSAWYLLAAGTPESFIMQYDTANGMSGGADPVKPIVDWPGRGASVHLKEWAGAHGAILGEGEIPWKRVLDACESVGGTKWYVIEYEIDEDTDPVTSVGKCLANLRALA
ncbi:MAG: sugar phosphate isomerase/epimerase family protein [Fimbriimonadaceae bacterium]